MERFVFAHFGVDCIKEKTILEAVAEKVALQGHENSQDIIRDPKVVEWADRYAERFRELTDPEWERMLDDPQSRWYRNGAA